MTLGVLNCDWLGDDPEIVMSHFEPERYPDGCVARLVLSDDLPFNGFGEFLEAVKPLVRQHGVVELILSGKLLELAQVCHVWRPAPARHTSVTGVPHIDSGFSAFWFPHAEVYSDFRSTGFSTLEHARSGLLYAKDFVQFHSNPKIDSVFEHLKDATEDADIFSCLRTLRHKLSGAAESCFDPIQFYQFMLAYLRGSIEPAEHDGRGEFSYECLWSINKLCIVHKELVHYRGYGHFSRARALKAYDFD